jgi:hypothetical protein
MLVARFSGAFASCTDWKAPPLHGAHLIWDIGPDKVALMIAKLLLGS